MTHLEGILKNKSIELSFFPHTDLYIIWPRNIEESVSTDKGKEEGVIVIKYSEIPFFVYFIAKKIGTDFLPNEIIKRAKQESYISFADMNVEDFHTQAEYFQTFREKLWKALEQEETKDKIFYEDLRFLKELFPGPEYEYIGYVPPPNNNDNAGVNMLYKDNNIYLSQRKNVLRLDDVLSKELLKRTIEHYGLGVSPCLNALEIKSKQD